MHHLIRTLLDPDLDPEEIMKAHDIYPCVADLEPGSLAFVYRSRKGRYYIIIDSSLSPEAREKTFWHEAHHILVDMPRTQYVVGLDMQGHSLEVKADMFVREVAAKYLERDVPCNSR